MQTVRHTRTVLPELSGGNLHGAAPREVPQQPATACGGARKGACLQACAGDLCTALVLRQFTTAEYPQSPQNRCTIEFFQKLNTLIKEK